MASNEKLFLLRLFVCLFVFVMAHAEVARLPQRQRGVCVMRFFKTSSITLVAPLSVLVSVCVRVCVKQFSLAVSLMLRVLSCGCVCGERDLSSTPRQEFKYCSWQFMWPSLEWKEAQYESQLHCAMCPKKKSSR